MEKGKYWLSAFLLLAVLTSSVYLILDDNVRIDIQKTRSIFQVQENGEWVISGIEYVNLFDGTAKMRASSRYLDTFVDENNFTTITRIANYKDNISTIEIYTFDPNTKDVALFPLNHSIQVINGEGKILQYEVQRLLYSEDTIKDIKSPQSFGHQMEVEWEDGNYYSRIYKYSGKDEGKLTIKYKIYSNDYSKLVRLFDPPITGNNLIIDNGETITLGGNNDTYDIIWIKNGTLQINSSIGYLNLTINNLTIEESGVISGSNLITTGLGDGIAGLTCSSGSADASKGGGGGGHNGIGGNGGAISDPCSPGGGIGGSAYPEYTRFIINNGSKGGSGGNQGLNAVGGIGGFGGSSLHINAINVTINGSINLNGGNGDDGSTPTSFTSAGGGGGGSGGMLVIDASNINLNGSSINLNGGNGGVGSTNGGACTSTTRRAASGGGGGSGGIIKIFYREKFYNNYTSQTYNGGSGGSGSTSCGGSVSDGISGSAGTLLINQTPTVESNMTSLDSNFTTGDIITYCNGTVNETRNMTYYWNIYKDGVINQSDNTGNITSGTQINIYNITSSMLLHNETWKLECIVSDFIYNNSDISEIQVHQPIFLNITFPINESSYNSSFLNISYQFENYTEVDSCWYTNDSGINNYSMDCDGQQGPDFWLEGNNNVFLYSNSTSGYETMDYVNFFTIIGASNIEFDEDSYVNNSWLSQDYIRTGTVINPCTGFYNCTYYLRGVEIYE